MNKLNNKFDNKIADFANMDFRVYIKELDENNLEELVECANDKNVSEGVNSNLIPYPFTKMNAKIIIERNKLGIEKHFGIFLKNKNKLIGNIVIFNRNGDNAEIGYWINSNYTGKRYAKEAIILLLDLCLNNLNLKKIYARIRRSNKFSIRLVKSLNFIEENLLNENLGGDAMDVVFSLQISKIVFH